MAKSALDAMIERIDADTEKLAAMKVYLLACAGDETTREAPKAKRGRKKKAGLPTPENAAAGGTF